MSIRNKKEIIDEFKINDKDTGSTAVQVALITAKIKHLSDHSKVHKKDNHSNRGLVLAVSERKKLLKYLKKSDQVQYNNVIAALGLRK